MDRKMNKRYAEPVWETVLRQYEKELARQEKSSATMEKYIRCARRFTQWLNGARLSKEKVIEYKEHLQEKKLRAQSVNGHIAALNRLFDFLGQSELKVKALKLQRQVYCQEEKELTRAEYERLCGAAKQQQDDRLLLMLQTLCATGIRVSELQYVTAEAVKQGKAVIRCKAKTRTVFIVQALQKKLLWYIRQRKIIKGPVFVTRSGRPMDRVAIWRAMKSLCALAGVDSRKVFPHNLRHLFARMFYELQKDIAKLSDVLGHSSINTTRIYIMTTGAEHRRWMEKMKLV